MKKLYTIITLVLPALLQAQSTPSLTQGGQHPNEVIVSERDFGDTITFNEQLTGAIITDQYAFSHGAIFSGWPAPNYCDIYDYTGVYGPILKSSSWYDGIRIDFVDPLDTTVSMPICRFGLNNPIDTEIDVILIKMYDADDNVLLTHASVSPELTVMEITSATCTYVTLEDEAGQAYVVDDVWFSAGSCPVNIAESAPAKSGLLVYPNPAASFITLDANGTFMTTLNVVDVTGRVVQTIVMNSDEKMQVNIATLSAGLYHIADSSGKELAKLVVE